MKKLIMFILLIIMCGCTSFNRDALWNAPIAHSDYCTYFSEDFPVGSLFVHKCDDWTQKRLKYGYELKVIHKINNDTYVLDHGWTVTYKLLIDGTTIPMNHRPIIVKILNKNNNIKVGDFFIIYGQYKYISIHNFKNKKYKNIKYFEQINHSQDDVVEPLPFIYFR